MVIAQSGPAVAEEIVYPGSDGEPLAETSVHVDAIIHAVVTLRQYLAQQQVIVLADQFLYYAQGYPKLRVAPDIMVIWDVPPGPRDNYKIWQEGSVPSVIFEMRQRAEQERQRAEQERQRAEQERQRAEQAETQVHTLMAKLKAMGIDIDE